jgi:Domain of unknown function (DUF4262)
MSAPPQVQARVDQDVTDAARTIRRYGQSIQFVLGRWREPTFAYTIGMFGLGHPELLVFGLDRDTAAAVLNRTCALVRSGCDLVPGEEVEIEGWSHRLTVEDLPNPGDVVLLANRYYDRPAGSSVPVVQLTYDDRCGRFPWDPGYGLAEWLQPRPGTFP